MPNSPAAAAGSAAPINPSTPAGAAGGGASTATPSGPDVALKNSAKFTNYMADVSGRSLYMFANDVPGSNTSACSGACLDKWPVFDAKEIEVGAGLMAADFTRFQRTEGTWQTAYKGHPLYRFAMDTTEGAVNGDGAMGRWFVARDYIAFLAVKPELTPQGASAAASPYMTNRMGRTVYVFMNDTAGKAGTSPVSACSDMCLDAWPTWNAPMAAGALTLPSSMAASDFGQLERTVGGMTVKQLTYRGWPLYFHTPDMMPGTTSGHMTGAWRAFDPTMFGKAAATGTASSTAGSAAMGAAGTGAYKP